MKTIGIIGTRRRNSQKDFIKLYHNTFREHYNELLNDQIVSGGCPKGGDRFAEIIALTLVGVEFDVAWRMDKEARQRACKGRKAPITIHNADWSIGRHAGFVRNTKIAEDCDILIAVVAPDRTGGTEDTIKKAKKLGKKIVLVE